MGMKDTIERKLGCSLENFMENILSQVEKNQGYEVDRMESFFPDTLTVEELDFISNYFYEKSKKI